MIWPILTVAIAQETDIVLTRQRARQIATLLGFDVPGQTRLTTAVSEIARNAFEHGGGGRIAFHALGGDATPMIEIRIADHGSGIANLEALLLGQHESEKGLGIGLRGARRLMDEFTIESKPGRGTTVTMRKALPHKAPRLTTSMIARLTEALMQSPNIDPMAEIRRQNQELLTSLEEIKARQEELERVNQELEDTNRGVVALYGELDEQADHLRKADEVKTRFLSNMSHEVRTPINSILALSRMLIERLDGALNDEQDKQVRLIRSAAETLSELVDDMLDLAKAEAGKIEIHPAPVVVEDVFSALRGMMRPLLTSGQVALVFDDASAVPPLHTDESKVAQILRNLISNAIKFTEQGEISVSVDIVDEQTAAFRVRDTGIGIAPEDHARIFEEYAQIDSPLQRKVKGSGLGLPLSRRLAELLGGRLDLASTPGIGSVFTLTLPRRLDEPAGAQIPGWQPDPTRLPVLAIEDTESDGMLLTRYLESTRYQLVVAATIEAARRTIAAVRPRAIVLDVMLAGEQCWPFLVELKRGWATRDIPIIVVASAEDERRARGMGADDYARKPIDKDWLLGTLDQLVAAPGQRKVLIVDDDMRSRYVLRRYLTDASCLVSEAAWGFEGVRRATEEQPDLVILDLMMPDIDGYEVLDLLDRDERTRCIPVVIVTSTPTAQIDRPRLARAAAVVGKHQLSKESLETMLAFSRQAAATSP
jgi:signal transduction histidine kinase/CheY-like chemotaxis protein